MLHARGDPVYNYSATATLTGAIVVGGQWTIKLDTTSFSTTVHAADTRDIVASALATAINGNVAAGFTATTAPGGILTIAKTNGTLFTGSFTSGAGTVVPGAGQAGFKQGTYSGGEPVLTRGDERILYRGGEQSYYATNDPKTTATPQQQIVVSGLVTAGQVWTLTLNSGTTSGSAVTYRYTAVAGDTLAKVSSGLAALVNAGGVFTAVAGNQFVVDGSAFTATLTAPDGSVAIDAPRSLHSYSATATLTGAIVVDDVWTLSLDGSAFSYQVVADDTRNDVAAALAAAINSASSGLSATLNGSTLTLTKRGGATFAGSFTSGTGTVTGAVSTTRYGHAAFQLDTGMPGTIVYFGVENVNLSLGSGNDLVTVQTTATGSSVLIQTGAGNDRIAINGYDSVAGLGVRGNTTVWAEGGDDVVYLGSKAGLWSTTGTFLNVNGDANGIHSTITVDGGSGTDLVVVNDTNDPLGSNGTLSGTLLTGIFGSGGQMAYFNLEQLDINLGNGGYRLDIFGTHTTLTNVVSGSGADVITIQSVSGVTNISTGAGPDTISVGSTTGVSSTPTATSTLNGILAALTINAGSGTDARIAVIKQDLGAFTAAITSGTGTIVNGVITLSGTVAAGSVWTITLNGQAFTYTATAGDNLYTVAMGLAAAVNNSGAGFTATPSADTLNAYDSGDTRRPGQADRDGADRSRDGGAGIGYSGVEALDIRLGGGDDTFFVDSTPDQDAPLLLNAGATARRRGQHPHDRRADATIEGGAGNDTVRVNYGPTGVQTFLNGVGALLTLRGQARRRPLRDRPLRPASPTGPLTSIVVDDQSPANDPGVNQLLHLRHRRRRLLPPARQPRTARSAWSPRSRSTPTASRSRRLLRARRLRRRHQRRRSRSSAATATTPSSSTTTLAPTTIFGDAGDDTFQIGQVFQSARDGSNPDNGLGTDDYFETTQTTRGFLSNGISQTTTLFGGIGNDSFTVYHNLAELFLFGEEDDDTFRVRAFVRVNPNDPKAPFTNINGGQGADFISYTVNAPVRIEGGDGLDTLVVVGTEFGDDFVVTDKGVFGAGLFITYAGDREGRRRRARRATTASTSQSTQPERRSLELVGGLGSDTFNIGGGNNGNADHGRREQPRRATAA